MRYYTKGKKQYKSVTSLISEMYPFKREGFDSWCRKEGHDPDEILDVSRIMGTKVSNWIDNSVKGITQFNSPAVGQAEVELLNGVNQFLKDVEVLETETTVYCDELQYAGTFDGIVMYKGKKYLADWKTYGAWDLEKEYKRNTSKIKKVRIQTTMYNNARDEDLDLMLVVFKNDGTYEIEILKPDMKGIEYAESLINQD